MEGYDDGETIVLILRHHDDNVTTTSCEKKGTCCSHNVSAMVAIGSESAFETLLDNLSIFKLQE